MIDAEFVRIAVAVAAGIVLALIALGVVGILFVVIFANGTYGPTEVIMFPVALVAIVYGGYLLVRAATQRPSAVAQSAAVQRHGLVMWTKGYNDDHLNEMADGIARGIAARN